MNKRILNNIHFLKVRGNLVERFRSSSFLMKDEIALGAADYLAKRNTFLIRHHLSSWMSKLTTFVYDKALIPYLKSRLNKEQRAAIRAFSEGAAISEEMYTQLLFHPDLFLLLARISKIAAPGCTSSVVFRERTKGKKMLIARNLDYPAVGFWEKMPMVVFNEPDEPGEIPYVFIASAGLHSGSLTSMNQEGLTLSLHAHVGRKVSCFGVPITFLGDEIIRKAKTIDQAIDLARKSKVLANWSFVIASGKENEAVVVEMTPRKVCVHNSKEGLLIHTNFFQAKELENEENILGPVVQEDARARFFRMNHLLQHANGPIEPKNLIAMLGDHIDHYTGQERVFGNTISVINTVCSLVMEPEGQRMWLSTRTESPTGLGPFLEIDLNRFWQEPESTSLTFVSQSPTLLEAIKWYREAYREYPQNPEMAQIHLEKAMHTYPQDGHLWVQGGLLAYQRGQFEVANKYFLQSQSLIVSSTVGTVRDHYLEKLKKGDTKILLDLQFPGPLCD